MGNVLKTHRKTELLTLVRAEHAFRDIERRLGINRETVSKYAREAGLWPLSKPATPSPEVATGFCDPISASSGGIPIISTTAEAIPKVKKRQTEKKTSDGATAFAT